VIVVEAERPNQAGEVLDLEQFVAPLAFRLGGLAQGLGPQLHALKSQGGVHVRLLIERLAILLHEILTGRVFLFDAVSTGQVDGARTAEPFVEPQRTIFAAIENFLVRRLGLIAEPAQIAFGAGQENRLGFPIGDADPSIAQLVLVGAITEHVRMHHIGLGLLFLLGIHEFADKGLRQWLRMGGSLMDEKGDSGYFEIFSGEASQGFALGLRRHAGKYHLGAHGGSSPAAGTEDRQKARLFAFRQYPAAIEPNDLLGRIAAEEGHDLVEGDEPGGLSFIGFEFALGIRVANDDLALGILVYFVEGQPNAARRLHIGPAARPAEIGDLTHYQGRRWRFARASQDRRQREEQRPASHYGPHDLSVRGTIPISLAT